ncbi:MAG: hypothetical protein ABSH38_17880 [Verrucomicrobiota bacterium]|jgi:hypothetical protein
MKDRNRQVKTRFGPETRFEIAPIPSVPFRGTLECELDHLKARLLRQMLEQAGDPEFNAPLRRAANEAASLAWFTPFPLLVFPVLLEEKAEAVQRQMALQREIRQRSQGLLRTAAA